MDAARLREAYENLGQDGASAFGEVLAPRVRWLDARREVLPSYLSREEVVTRMRALGWEDGAPQPRNFVAFDDRVVVPLREGGAHHWRLGDAGAVRLEVHPNRPAAMAAASGYRALLERLHERLQPRTYVEIGVNKGLSLGAALPGTRMVGIDPKPDIADASVADVASIHRMTSDDFFAQHDLRSELDGLPVDLAFIDGMHLFEFALRDFMNLERFATESSVILVHDVLPEGPEMAGRELKGMGWTGDVWKLLPCLRDVRPDLGVVAIDSAPTGLGMITGLDPGSTVLHERYDEIVERYVPLELETLEHVEDDWDLIESLLPS